MAAAASKMATAAAEVATATAAVTATTRHSAGCHSCHAERSGCRDRNDCSPHQSLFPCVATRPIRFKLLYERLVACRFPNEE
jgi:hypothetical protein